MKKFLLFAFCFLLFFSFSAPVLAQKAGGPIQTCDVCGGCVGQEPPQDHGECIACVAKGDEYSWTVLGCLPTSPGGFVQAILRVFTSVIGGISFLALLYGGVMFLTAGGNPERIEAGKSILIAAVGGLFLVVFAVFILRFIGVEVFNLPGFG